MDKVRTIIIDGVEIQTSLTAVEISSLQQKNQELEQQVKKQKEVIDRIQKIINTEIKLMSYAVNDSCLMLIQDILKEVSE